jgi:hypothetical protein
MTALADISTAPTAGLSNMPSLYNAPAAGGVQTDPVSFSEAPRGYHATRDGRLKNGGPGPFSVKR